MSRLKELKEEFTKITGLPAKKMMVDVVCEGVGDRRMMSIFDWEWALNSIAPRFKMADREAKIAELEEQLTQSTQAGVEPLQPIVEDEIELLVGEIFLESSDCRTTYRRLSKRYHPDLNPDNPNAVKLSVIVNRVYEEVKENGNYQNDRIEKNIDIYQQTDDWEKDAKRDADGVLDF